MKPTTTAAVVIVAVVGVLGLTWLIQGNEFFMYKYFGPRREAVRRQIFETSRAFNQGMVQELQNMQFDYVKLGAGQVNEKAALASIILHRSSGFNLDDPIVPTDLRDFINGLKRERGVR